jgi:hypothetical protein
MSDKLSIPISKVRRNTKEFLGEDAKATRRSGYKREFSVNDGFYVYLGGTLVSKYGLSFGNARKAIDVIKPWLLLSGLVPEPAKDIKRKGIDKDILDYYVTFLIYEGQLSQVCEIKGVIESADGYSKDSSGRKYSWKETKEYYYFIKNNSGKIEYFLFEDLKEDDRTVRLLEDYTPIWEIPVTRIFLLFIERIFGSEAWMEFVKSRLKIK